MEQNRYLPVIIDLSSEREITTNKENDMDVTAKHENAQAVAVVRELSGQDACHAVGCKDLAKARQYSDVYYEMPNLAAAEQDYNDSLGIEAGYEEPWIWSRDVKIYPCTKK